MSFLVKNVPEEDAAPNGVNGKTTRRQTAASRPRTEGGASANGSAKDASLDVSLFSLVPKPVRLTVAPGNFRLDSEVAVVTASEARPEAQFLVDRLTSSIGRLSITEASDIAGHRIELRIDPDLTNLGREGYRLTVSNDAVLLRSTSRAGLFYGLQTLLQLLPASIFDPAKSTAAWSIPCVEIEDFPRFAWRGAMLDVARHFMPVDSVKKFIDLLALHKLNTLHLHLNDDQGWRIEINKYPRLTTVGARRDRTILGPVYQNPIDDGFDFGVEEFDGKPHGGFYTQADARELVEYASTRHVTLVPEIDMPGHAQAAIVAYPELGNRDVDGRVDPAEISPRWGIHGHIFNVRESTIGFLQDVLAEVMEIFPSPYIHIGGDECHKHEWKHSPEVQARMKELGLSTVEEMQSYFIRRMDEFVDAHGRRIVGWDEILEGGLAPNAVVMSWRGEQGGIDAARAGHDVVMSPSDYTYFDYYQSTDKSHEPQAFPRGYVPLSKVYGYEPVPKELPAKFAHHVLGAQGQLWSEYMPHPAQVEYMAFPRLCALAEVTWTPIDAREFEDFLLRLHSHFDRLDLLEVNYRPVKPSELSTVEPVNA